MDSWKLAWQDPDQRRRDRSTQGCKMLTPRVPIRHHAFTECLACFRHRQIFRGYIMQNPTAGIPPVIMSVKDACQWSHLSRSEMYRQLAVGTIGAVKLRSRTFVLVDGLRQFIANLPAAKFRS
jgi:hypothetical protein